MNQVVVLDRDREVDREMDLVEEQGEVVSESGTESGSGTEPESRSAPQLRREGRTLMLKSVLREIVSNARESGESPTQALDDKADIGPELLQLAVMLESESLNWWRRNLRWLSPDSAHLLATLELLRDLIVEKMPVASVNDRCGVHSTDPQLNERYQWWLSAVETGKCRQSLYPERADDLGYDARPSYDGGDFAEGETTTVAPKFWLRVTSVVAWPSKREIVSLDELRSAYRASLGWPKGPIHFPMDCTGEVAWWLRNHRPVLDRKIIFRNPTKVEAWAKAEDAECRRLASQFATGDLQTRAAFKRKVRQWLGTITDALLQQAEQPVALALEMCQHKIARTRHNRIAKPIGLFWVPGWIGGDVATAYLQENVTRLTKQTGETDRYWALQGFYDPEGAETVSGQPEVQTGLRQLLAKHGVRARQVLKTAQECPYCN